MSKVDRAVGAALAVLGAAVVWTGSTFPAVPGQKLGAGFLPMLVGGGLLVCGLLLMARRAPAGSSADAAESLPSHRYIPATVVLASLAGYVLLAERLGFMIVAPAMVLACCRAFGTGWRAAALWAIGGSLVVHLAFYKLLRVPLPWGLLRPWY